MKDWWHEFTNWVDHNRWQAGSMTVAVILFIAIGIWQGCESTTMGFRGERVPRSVFTIEALQSQQTLEGEQAQIQLAIEKNKSAVKAHNAMVDAGTADLDRQDEAKVEALETIGAVVTQAATGGFNPVSLIPTAIGLIGTLGWLGVKKELGRKDAVITSLKLPTKTPTA